MSRFEKQPPPFIIFNLVIREIEGKLAIGIPSEGVPKFYPLVKPPSPTITQAIQVESGVHILCNGPVESREYLRAKFAGMPEFWDQKARLPFSLRGKDPRGDIEDWNPPDIKNRTPHYGIPLQGYIYPFCGKFPIGRSDITRGEGCIVHPVGAFAELFRPLPRDIEVALPGEQCPIDNGPHLRLQIQFQTITFQNVSPLPQYHVALCHRIIVCLVQLHPVCLEGEVPSNDFDMSLGHEHPLCPIVAQGVGRNLNRPLKSWHRHIPLLAGRGGGKEEKVTEDQGMRKREGRFGHQNEFNWWHRGMAF